MFRFLAAAALLPIMCCGCATSIGGKSETVHIASEPHAMVISVDPRYEFGTAYNVEPKRVTLLSGEEERPAHHPPPHASPDPQPQPARQEAASTADDLQTTLARAATVKPPPPPPSPPKRVPASRRVTAAELQRKVQRFARNNPPYGTHPDRWLRDRQAEYDGILASMSGCVVGELGGDGSTTLVQYFVMDVPRAMRTWEASHSSADRLAAARDLVFTLKLLQQQWRAITPMPVLDGLERTRLPRTGSVVKLCEEPYLLPGNGDVFDRDGPAEARLTVRVQPGAGNCLVKLVRSADGFTVMSFFVRDGESAEVDAPADRYELRYAGGVEWYGRRYLFGPLTFFMRVETQLVLTADTAGGPYVLGPSGDPGRNVDTTPITPGEF